MYYKYLVLYFSLIILPNANLLVVENNNLSHIDGLYFKHNKRHKWLNTNTHHMKYSFQIQSPLYKSHIENFNSLESETSKHDSDLPKTQKFNSLFVANDDRIFQLRRNFKHRFPMLGHKAFNRRRQFKGRKRFNYKGKKNYESTLPRNEEYDKWVFKDIDQLGNKVSEYEGVIANLKQLSRSENKNDKDLYSFLKKGLKEASSDPNIPVKKFDVIKALDKQEYLDDLKQRRLENRLNLSKMKIYKKLRAKERKIKIHDPIEYNIKQKALEDSCGFRYPIEGTPDEIFATPNDYKLWGRTPLSMSQNAHLTREHTGKLEEENDEFENIIALNGPRHDKKLMDDLVEMRKDQFEQRMDNVLKSRLLDEDNQNDEYKYRTDQFENYYEDFKRKFLGAELSDQEKILRVLNPYNPWDEYIRMKNLKSSLPPMALSYRLNLNKMDVSFKANESLAKDTIRSFLMDYLHYFLILESDQIMFDEFKNAKFIHDILKYFDIDYEIPVEQEQKILSLQDRFFQIYFPDQCPDGLPPRLPESRFPVTIENQPGVMQLAEKITGKENSHHRVNMICSLMALARCHPLMRSYSADIFSEERFKNILGTIETGLTLELERLNYGISEIEIGHLNYRSLCNVDGIYLATLTEVLIQWNLRRGVENILDLVLLLTLKKFDEIDPKSLVAILNNVSYLTTLPESVYINFLSKIVDFVHERIKYSLVNKLEYMPLEVALDFLRLLSKYPSIVTREFMESFMQLYMDSILNFVKNTRAELDDVSSTYDDADEAESFVENRRLQMYALVSCLQLSGMTEYMYLLNELTDAFSGDDLLLNSMAATSVLASFTDHDEFQRRVLMRAKNCLVKDKYQFDAQRILTILQTYLKGVNSGRLEVDENFFCTMIRMFASLKDPDSDALIGAAKLADEFAPNLTSRQLFEIFRDLTVVPLNFNFMTRVGMRGELLDYPISTMAKVLYYSSKNKVIIEENWKTFYDIIYVFKHILSLEDINLILDSLIMTNFTKADKLLEILCKRVCNILEIADVGSDKVLEVMDKFLSLDYVPIHLLRFYTYSNIFELQGSDLINKLVDGVPEYDVDFRGWKRPLSYDEHYETVKMHHNVYGSVKMKGSRPVLHESMKYPLQPTHNKPRTFEAVRKANFDNNVLKLLANYVERVRKLNYKFTERDRKLMDSLMKIVKGKEIETIIY